MLVHKKSREGFRVASPYEECHIALVHVEDPEALSLAEVGERLGRIGLQKALSGAPSALCSGWRDRQRT